MYSKIFCIIMFITLLRIADFCIISFGIMICIECRDFYGLSFKQRKIHVVSYGAAKSIHGVFLSMENIKSRVQYFIHSDFLHFIVYVVYTTLLQYTTVHVQYIVFLRV